MSDSVGFYNSSGEAIPPYAVMQVEGVEVVGGRSVVKVRKPTGSENEAGYLLNGFAEVPIGKTGTAYTGSEPAWAHYDDADTPATGEEWGAEDDSWKLVSGEKGFRIIGGEDSVADRVLVRTIGQGGSVRVIGPCAVYTPDISDPDTDFETAYPDGCDGPDVLGLNITNLIPGPASLTIVRMEVESTGPLVLSTDTFSFTCPTGSRSIYVKIEFPGIDLEEVVATIYNDSDDSVLQTYTNTLYSWDPLAGGNLQAGPDNTSCDCGSLPFDLCFSIPTR